MNSIGENCNELKKNYDACFNHWFSERFLKGDTDDSSCAPIFKLYQQCVKVFHNWLELRISTSVISSFQDAMQQHKVEIKDVEQQFLGTSKEEIPNPKNKKSSWFQHDWNIIEHFYSINC